MTDYNKDEVALWKNDKRESDRHPHYKGSATVNGVEYWASAWAKGADANPNAPLVKISLKPKEDAPKPAPAPVDFEIDDDLPF